MPAYNFQRRFVFPILLGTKPHTIRRKRKNPTEAGDRIMMFTEMRTKQCVQFGASVCVKVEPLILYPAQAELLVDDGRGAYRWMSDYEITLLAQRDGFADANGFFKFFRDTYKTHGSAIEMLDDFEIVHWDPMRVEVVPGVRIFSAVRMWAVRGTAAPYKPPLDRDAFLRNVEEVKHETR